MSPTNVARGVLPGATSTCCRRSREGSGTIKSREFMLEDAWSLLAGHRAVERNTRDKRTEERRAPTPGIVKRHIDLSDPLTVTGWPQRPSGQS